MWFSLDTYTVNAVSLSFVNCVQLFLKDARDDVSGAIDAGMLGILVQTGMFVFQH